MIVTGEICRSVLFTWFCWYWACGLKHDSLFPDSCVAFLLSV